MWPGPAAPGHGAREHPQRYWHPGAAGLSTVGGRGAAPALPVLLQGGAAPMGALQTCPPPEHGTASSAGTQQGQTPETRDICLRLMCVWVLQHRLWASKPSKVGGECEVEKVSPRILTWLPGDGEQKPCRALGRWPVPTIQPRSEQDGNATGWPKGPRAPFHCAWAQGRGERRRRWWGVAVVGTRAPLRSWGWGGLREEGSGLPVRWAAHGGPAQREPRGWGLGAGGFGGRLRQPVEAAEMG